jgi:hypothetical protein
VFSDFANLQKGTTIPQWWIEGHVGIKADEDIEAYNLARMDLGSEIERAIRQKQGIEVFVKYRGRELRILDDFEAEIEGPRRLEQAVRKIRRTYRKLCDINTVAFDQETLKRFEHNRRVATYQVEALNDSRKDTGTLLKPRVPESVQ